MDNVSDTIVLATGRMNPPHKGHALLVDKVLSYNLPHIIILTSTHDNKKNPLKPLTKLYYALVMFKKANIILCEIDKPSIFHYVKFFSGKYKNLIIVTGQDHLTEYSNKMKHYNGKEWIYENIDVVSCGERNENSNNLDGLSSSKMRQFAKENNFDKFQSKLPYDFPEEYAYSMFLDVQRGLKS